MIIQKIAIFIILIFSFIFHEYIHALSAYGLGDKSDTIKKRMTLNPIPHLDIMGSVLLPLVLLFSNASFIFGWAKPVNINIDSFKNPNRDIMLVSIAGPLANLFIAIVSILILKLLIYTHIANTLLYSIFFIVIFTNTILFIFNILPISPLDGSRILFFVLSNKYKILFAKYSWILMILLFIAVFLGFTNPLFNGIVRMIRVLVL